MNKLAFVFALTLGSVSLSATTPEMLNLATVLKKGLESSIEINKGISQVTEAEATLSKYKGTVLPTLAAKASADTHQNSTTTSSGAVGSYSSSVGESYQTGLELSQPLYAGGAISSGLSYGRVGVEMAKLDLHATKQKTALTLIKSFYGLAKAQDQLAAAKQNKEILKSYLDVTERYTKIGRSRKMDLIQANVNYSLSSVDEEQLKKALSEAANLVKRGTGIDDKTDIQADFKLVIYKIESLSLGQALDLAAQNLPELRLASLRIEQAQHVKDLDLSTDFPSLTLNGTAGYSAPDRTNLFNESSKFYKVGLNLTIPLFSGFTSIAKSDVGSEKIRQAQRDREILLLDTREKIANALNQTESSLKQLIVLQDAVNQARQALELANKAYQQGTASSSDVLNFQRTRYDAEKQYLTAQYSYLETLANLRYQLGFDLEKTYAR